MSKATHIECQSNDELLTSLLHQFGRDIQSNVILFKDGPPTNLQLNNAIFRKRDESDQIFEHHSEPVGSYVLELNHEVVATGGFLLHYNPPFADLHMEVKENYRRKGFGSYLIQELRKQCYLSGKAPAARCDADNIASCATLIKGGLEKAGVMLAGKVN